MFHIKIRNQNVEEFSLAGFYKAVIEDWRKS